MMVLGIWSVIWGLPEELAILQKAENRTVESPEYCEKNMGVKDLAQPSVGY